MMIAAGQALNLPTPAELAPTEDVQITPAIQAKAAELHHNPVEIYNWVHNNIEFIPSYGSIQGSQLTLDKLQGNAFDTASLLIALLRASNIPARYVYGAIEVPTAQALNWLGNFDVPSAAQQILGQGGVPSGFVTSGGNAFALRTEHVWVEAWVDFYPSRGAKHLEGDSWVPMDGSFKQYTYSDGMNLQGEVPFDAQAFLDASQQGATINEQEGWVQNLNQANIQAKLNEYQQQLETFINNHDPDPTLGDVLGRKTIQQNTATTLIASLPYKKLVTGSIFSSLPTTLRHQFQYNLYLDQHQRAIENPVLTYQESTPNLAGKKITLTYVPASEDDRHAINSYLPAPHADGSPMRLNEYPSQLPAYSIHVRAELRVEGGVVATGGTYSLGTELLGEGGFTNMNLQDWDLSTDPHVAGQQSSLGLSLQGIGLPQLQFLKSRIQQTQNAIRTNNLFGITGEQVSNDLLTSIIWTYFAAIESYGKTAKLRARVADIPALSYGFVHSEARPFQRYNVTFQVRLLGALMDVGHLRRIVSANDGDQQKMSHYNKVRGQHSSAMEHAVPEVLLTNASQAVVGVSAVKALMVAGAAGQRIFTITQHNQARLTNIHQSPSVMEAIQNAIAAGKEVTIHERPINYAGFSGAGYVVIDPLTGSGAYMIEGGANGAALLALLAAVWLVMLMVLIDEADATTIEMQEHVNTIANTNEDFLNAMTCVLGQIGPPDGLISFVLGVLLSVDVLLALTGNVYAAAIIFLTVTVLLFVSCLNSVLSQGGRREIVRA